MIEDRRVGSPDSLCRETLSAAARVLSSGLVRSDACDPCPLDITNAVNCPNGVPVVNSQQTYDTIDAYSVAATLAELQIYGSAAEGRVGMYVPDETRDTSVNATERVVRALRKRQYELKDHLGNVRVVLSDLKRSGVNGINRAPWEPDVLSYSNYYPYGMLQPDRYWNAPSYRYGFNGKEKDDEVHSDAVTGAVAGEGNSYDYGFRVYDPRIARFLSVDPLADQYPMLTPYQFASNTPIQAVDLEGLEAAVLTFELRAILSGSSIGVATSSSISFAIDAEGRVALFTSGSLGVGVGRALTAGLEVTVFPTATVSDISSGWGIGAGVLYAPLPGMPGPAVSLEASASLVKELGAKFAGSWGINSMSVGAGAGAWAEVKASLPIVETSIDEIGKVLDKSVGAWLETIGVTPTQVTDALKRVQKDLERLPVPPAPSTLETGSRGPDALAPADETKRKIDIGSAESGTRCLDRD